SLRDIKRITVETHRRGKEHVGTEEELWRPETREVADHSMPYVVAAALMEGTVTLRSYNDDHLASRELRSLMQKIEVVANAEFTERFERGQQLVRITVLTESGERRVAESGGDGDDVSEPPTAAAISEKFRRSTEEIFGARRVDALLDRLWHLDDN